MVQSFINNITSDKEKDNNSKTKIILQPANEID